MMRYTFGSLIFLGLLSCTTARLSPARVADSPTAEGANLESFIVVGKCSYESRTDQDAVLSGDAFVTIIADRQRFPGNWNNEQLTVEDNKILYAFAGIASESDTLSGSEIKNATGLSLNPAWIHLNRGRLSQMSWRQNNVVYGFDGCGPDRACLTTNGTHPNSGAVYPSCNFHF